MFIPKESMPSNLIKQEEEYDIIIPHVSPKPISKILFRDGMKGNESSTDVKRNAVKFANYLWNNVCISFFSPLLQELNRLNNQP